VDAASDGPVEDVPGVQSDWQLASFPAVRADGSISGQDEMTHWIWNEGFPAEIATFEGTRLIAVGPSTIQRSWNAPRIFAGMTGWLRVEERLPTPEAVALLARMVAASAQRA
jgi:hypothetical protein